ncbi:MAG TPA: response regulator [Planctomycetota bacterium]|nr:response regulator [Planctomycetota bacterium]
MARILLIEDQPNQRQLYQEELIDEGYEVIAAASGAAGLELYQQYPPDLVIVDILLPGLNGIEVIEKLLTLNPQVPIIVHSAYSSPSHDFITWFARAYVVKSGDLQELKTEVRKALSGTPVVETQSQSGLVSA